MAPKSRSATSTSPIRSSHQRRDPERRGPRPPPPGAWGGVPPPPPVRVTEPAAAPPAFPVRAKALPTAAPAAAAPTTPAAPPTVLPVVRRLGAPRLGGDCGAGSGMIIGAAPADEREESSARGGSLSVLRLLRRGNSMIVGSSALPLELLLLLAPTLSSAGSGLTGDVPLLLTSPSSASVGLTEPFTAPELCVFAVPLRFPDLRGLIDGLLAAAGGSASQSLS